MDSARARILNDFPYPVAYPYSLIFTDREADAALQALWFTQYQLLKVVGLALVSQYLREPLPDLADPRVREGFSSISGAIVRIRSPYYSDWIALLRTLCRYLPAASSARTLFPLLETALDSLKRQKEERPIGDRDSNRLDSLDAIRALRNGYDHGGIPDQRAAEQHLEYYLPVLHQVLTAFDFLGDSALRVCRDEPARVRDGRATTQILRGASLSPDREEKLSADLVQAFSESEAALTTAEGRTVPLYPLFNPMAEREPIYLYDGHSSTEKQSYIYYLGTHYAHWDPESRGCERLKALLETHQISFRLQKKDTAPWTIADSAAYYSRRTVEEITGSKYFPASYFPFPELETHLDRFLEVGDSPTSPDSARGFILAGPAGAGKTAFLAHRVERLLEEAPPRGNPNLVLFLRGDAIQPRSEWVSLFQDLAEKLGIAVGDASTALKPPKTGGFSSFGELLDHLDRQRDQDQVPGRRLLLILDALNEAPHVEQAVRQALELVRDAARFPWCKIVLSLREEWLRIWPAKMQSQERSPLEETRPFLYQVDQNGGVDSGRAPMPGYQHPPVMPIAPFTAEMAEAVYAKYQKDAQRASSEPGSRRLPACLTPWGELPEEPRDLLRNPLLLHLWMETFDGREAEPLTSKPDLFRHYVDRIMPLGSPLEKDADRVIAHLLQGQPRQSADLTDDDANAIRRKWADAHSGQETRWNLSPLEGLDLAGLIKKRVRDEGGGYRFVFQEVAEYLIYWYLDRQRPEELRSRPFEGTATDGVGAIDYWARQARPSPEFAEYRGAFAFLLRDWAREHGFDRIAKLVDKADCAWLRATLTGFLIERARAGRGPRTVSDTVREAAEAFSRYGGEGCAEALRQAGTELARGGSSAASLYLEASVQILDALSVDDPDSPAIQYGLAASLSGLGCVLADTGGLSEAERAYQRSVGILKLLHAAQPDDVDVGYQLAAAWHGLGTLLHRMGQNGAAAAWLQAMRVSEGVWKSNPENVALGCELGLALIQWSWLLAQNKDGCWDDTAWRRSVTLFETLVEAHPLEGDLSGRLSPVASSREAAAAARAPEMEIRKGLATALLSAAVLWRYRCAPMRGLPLGGYLRWLLWSFTDDFPPSCWRAGRRDREAEAACRRAVTIYEELGAREPQDVEIGDGLARAHRIHAGFLYDAGRNADAQDACRRSAEVYATLIGRDPQNAQTQTGYAVTLWAQGRNQDACWLCDELLSRAPGHGYALQLRGWILATMRGEVDNAAGLRWIDEIQGVLFGPDRYSRHGLKGALGGSFHTCYFVGRLLFQIYGFLLIRLSFFLLGVAGVYGLVMRLSGRMAVKEGAWEWGGILFVLLASFLLSPELRWPFRLYGQFQFKKRLERLRRRGSAGEPPQPRPRAASARRPPGKPRKRGGVR